VKPTPPIPVDRFLVPVPTTDVSAGFTLIDQALTNGLPQRLPLFADVSLALVVPHGLAKRWRDADPTDIVTHSDDERTSTTPATTQAAPPPRVPALLFLERAGTTLAAVPLVAGLRGTYPNGCESTQSTLVELFIISWEVRAGSMVGPGDFGSRIRLAWRNAVKAVDEFSPPPVDPRVARRLLGLDVAPAATGGGVV
jgi:hypothetical protein